MMPQADMDREMAAVTQACKTTVQEMRQDLLDIIHFSFAKSPDFVNLFEWSQRHARSAFLTQTRLYWVLVTRRAPTDDIQGGEFILNDPAH